MQAIEDWECLDPSGSSGRALSVANIHPRAGPTAPPCPPDLVSLLRGCLVSVMQASEPRPRHRSAAWNLGYCGATAGGSFLCKRVVRSIVVIVGDVLVPSRGCGEWTETRIIGPIARTDDCVRPALARPPRHHPM